MVAGVKLQCDVDELHKGLNLGILSGQLVQEPGRKPFLKVEHEGLLNPAGDLTGEGPEVSDIVSACLCYFDVYQVVWLPE